jgi:hypothetical protein
LIKDLRFTTSRVMGMNLWFAPQISEHCPKKKARSFREEVNLIQPAWDSVYFNTYRREGPGMENISRCN